LTKADYCANIYCSLQLGGIVSTKRMIVIKFLDGSVTTLYIDQVAANKFEGTMCHPKFGKSYDQANTWIDSYPRVELLEETAYFFALDRVGPIVDWRQAEPMGEHYPKENLRMVIDVEFHDGQAIEIPITHEAGGRLYHFEIHHSKFPGGGWKDGYPNLALALNQANRIALRIGRIVRFEERKTKEEQ